MVLVVAALLTGCGLRLETEDPPTTAPDDAEILRQSLARHADSIARTASLAATAEESDVATLLGAIATSAEEQRDVLGGVWVSSGRPMSAPVARGGAEEVLALLLAAADAARAAPLGSDDPALLVGLELSWALRADQLATASGGEPAGVDDTLPSTLDATSAVDLVRTVDAIGWLWEVRAARSGGDALTEASSTAVRWRARAEQLAEIAGLAGTDDDPREIAYAVDVDDPATSIATLTAELLPCWLAQVATTSGDDRGHVIDRAHLAARAAGLSAPDADVPAVVGTA